MYKVSLLILVVALLLVFAGCGGSSTSAAIIQPIAVTVTPNPASVNMGATQQFTASVTGTSNTAVTWAVDGVAGGNATTGVITTTGLYTAPNAVGNHTVTATAAADTTKSGTAAVTVPAVAVAVSPGTATVAEGASQQFTATVTGTSNTAVTWAVDGQVGGSDFVGSITTSGQYRAAVITGTHTVSATLQADATKSSSATVTIVVPTTGVSVIVSPSSLNLTTGGSAQFTSAVVGSTQTTVGWQVNGVPGGNTTVGVIDTTGKYTAPNTIPSPAAVTITALVTGSTSNSGSATVTVTGPGAVSVNLTPPSSAIGQGGWEQFTATVSGSANTAVTWLVNGIPNGNATVGTIDNTGLYLAPDIAVGAPVVVTATAAADATKTATSNVTVTSTYTQGTILNPTTVTCVNDGLTPPIDGTCYKLPVTGCPGIADQDAYIKVSTAAGTEKGTVLMLIGGGGIGLYEKDFTFGPTVINGLLGTGFNTVQVTFDQPFISTQPEGWLTGPGGARRLACRFATIAQWVHDNPAIHNSAGTAAFCGTGNSAGGSAIDYSLASYGMDSIFDMVETTSGPPLGRLDSGCLCSSPDYSGTVGSCTYSDIPVCFGTEGSLIDSAYGSPVCTGSEHNSASTYGALLLHDSVAAPGANYNYPSTDVNFVYGGQDKTQVIPLGLDYAQQVMVTGGVAATTSCVVDAPHPIASVQDGANTILNDLKARCKKQ